MSIKDFLRGLFQELTSEEDSHAREIAASDKRIADNIAAIHQRISSPDCTAETLDAASVCLDGMSVSLKKMGTDRIEGRSR